MAIEKLLEEALALGPKERADLAAALLRSLEPDADELGEEEWNEAWSKELEKRLEDYDQGRVKPLTHDEVMASIRARLGR
ncbi:MAG TPA: addiction module protein [Kofleriaceae bacterium]|jgi:putative addiction module component (TIGR02574 family)|nr:addiction module protein [Kofleriaceae bacterium]